MSSAVCWDRSENNSPSDRSMRGTSMCIPPLVLITAGLAEAAARAVRRHRLRRHRIDVAEPAVEFALIGVAIRRALEESRDAEADKERTADEQRGAAAGETVDVVHHVGDAFLSNLIREAA